MKSGGKGIRFNGVTRHLSQFPFHALVFSAYPILYLYAVNMVFIQPENILRSMGLSLGFTVFFLLSFTLILKNWEKAGLLCSLLVILFFLFGHVSNSLTGSELNIGVQPLTLIWLVIFLILGFLILKVVFPQKITLLINFISFVLILFPLVTIISTSASVSHAALESERTKLAEIRGQKQAEGTLKALPSNINSDIYFIILDAYERTDMLAQYYGYDNAEFIQELEKRGFYIATESRSNYLNTTYSMNTSLNLVYFDDFPKPLIKNARYNLQTNYVSSFLRNQGYQIIVYDSGTGDSNNQYADEFISQEIDSNSSQVPLNAFEALLIRTTMGLALLKTDAQGNDSVSQGEVLFSTVNHELDIRRERIQNAFEHLPDYATDDSAQFMFAHIYSPHIPFLYDKYGNKLAYSENVNMYWYEPAPEDYAELYICQIEYLNKAILTTIDQILAESHIPPVIILQSDHGDDHFLKWEEPDAQGVNIRTAILNAIYFPDENYKNLYPSITPVNTFRVVLNKYFGTSYPLLADRVFFHEHSLATSSNQIPEFFDACEYFDICLPSQAE